MTPKEIWQQEYSRLLREAKSHTHDRIVRASIRAAWNTRRILEKGKVKVDPDIVLEELRSMSTRLLKLEDESFIESRNEMALMAGELAQRVKDLSDWLEQGGHLPHRWEKARPRSDHDRKTTRD